MRRAVQAPCKQICNNAGEEGAVVVQNILANPDVNYGFDAAVGMLCVGRPLSGTYVFVLVIWLWPMP